jgi:prepilin-type N-terminal cleavage/methylation domain-containing protein
MARLFRKLGESEGFTIIEVLVVIAVLSVGLAAIAVA